MRGSAPSKSLSERSVLAMFFASEFLRGELKLGQVISRRTLASENGDELPACIGSFVTVGSGRAARESRPRAGTRVRIPTPQDVEGHFVVREALETQAARLPALTATPEEQAELFKLCDPIG